MVFTVRLSEEDGKLLDKKRGEISRNAYLVELLRRYDLGIRNYWEYEGFEAMEGDKSEFEKEIDVANKAVVRNMDPKNVEILNKKREAVIAKGLLNNGFKTVKKDEEEKYALPNNEGYRDWCKTHGSMEEFKGGECIRCKRDRR